MTAASCTGCGRLEVLDDLELDRRASEDFGHHVVPDDPDADWICYGKPVAIADKTLVAQVEKSYAERSIFGVDALQPSKVELARKYAEVDAARRDAQKLADATVLVAELDAEART